LLGTATAASPVRVDTQKLRKWADAFAVTELLQVAEDEVTETESPFAATPEDVENGDYEIQCSTNCDFVQNDMADFATGGKAALYAANDLALTQGALKKVGDRLTVDPMNEDLRLQKEKLELEVKQKTHALQVAAGASVPDLSGELGAASLEVIKARQAEVAAKLDKSPADEALVNEKNRLDRAVKAKEQALQSAAAKEQQDVALRAEVSNLNEKVKQLREEMADDPESVELQEKLQKMEGELAAKEAQEDAIVPRKECYKVCVNPNAQAGNRRLLAKTMEIDNCVRMCVKVMRQLVHRMGQSFL